MASGVQSWSKTAATNASADSAVNWAEGQAPSSVNDSARGLMASVAKWRDDQSGALTTAGSSTAYTVSSNQGFASLAAMDSAKLCIRFDEVSGAAPTLAVDGLTAKPFQSVAGTAVPSGFFLANSIWNVTYSNSDNAFIVQDVPGVLPAGTALPANSVVTATITDANVTNAKLANMANATVKGRATSGTGVPEDITLGQGLVLNSTTLTAPAFPPSSSFAKLVIKVTGNTGLTAAADFVTTTDGTNYKTTALSSTINMGTTGANALDTGSIASGTWYAIWAIAKADGTTAGLASTSFTTPTMPSDYTYKARIGAVRTASGSAQLLGTWQFGRRAQYVVGLAQTTATNIIIASGVAGSVSVPTWSAVSISNYVPTTASAIKGYAHVFNGSTIIAPNSSYQGNNSTVSAPPLAFNTGGSYAFTYDYILESTNIYWASDSANGQLYVHGWEDNL